jgi:hypothetical protein
VSRGLSCPDVLASRGQGAGSSRQGSGPLAVLSVSVTCWLNARCAGKSDNTARRRGATPWPRPVALAFIVLTGARAGAGQGLLSPMDGPLGAFPPPHA